VQRGYRDDQLCEISQRCDEQPVYCVTRLFGNAFGCVTKKSGKRHDREEREHEVEGVSRRRDPFGCQHERHEDQHPKQRAVPDFVEQRVHN
jgi:hypothetical protein